MSDGAPDNSQMTGGPQSHVLQVKTAELKVARSPCILETLAVGSCVAVSLYDPVNKIGSLCHSLLPGDPQGDMVGSLKFVGEAVKAMASTMGQEGASPEDIQAKVFGGATLFGCFEDEEAFLVGEKNVETARSSLKELGIAIVAEDVGGNQGRNVEFNTEDGRVTIRCASGTEKVL